MRKRPGLSGGEERPDELGTVGAEVVVRQVEDLREQRAGRGHGSGGGVSGVGSGVVTESSLRWRGLSHPQVPACNSAAEELLDAAGVGGRLHLELFVGLPLRSGVEKGVGSETVERSLGIGAGVLSRDAASLVGKVAAAEDVVGEVDLL